MASNYKSLKCDCCAGSLAYDRDKKVWVCQYCGNEIRREEEYDGLYTIKNVVKQVLIDLAYNRMENAEKNLVECEKIDSSYVGTIIARLSLLMFRMITQGACSEGTMRSLMGQLKRSYEALEAIDNGVSTEEEALYENFENSDEAFGVLVLVFDSLGAYIHQKFVENLLHAGNIYSTWLNEKLLHYGIKNKKIELTESILNNVENINGKQAFQQVINVYEDGEEKRRHVKELAQVAHFLAEDKKDIELYLQHTEDSEETKVCVYVAAAEAGAPASVEYVERYILGYVEENSQLIDSVLGEIVSLKPNDGELYYILEKIYTMHKGGTALCEMEALAGSGLFIQIPSKIILAMLNRTDIDVEKKVRLLEMAEQEEMGRKDNEMILSSYLCRNDDEPKVRLDIVKILLNYVKVVPTSTIEEYLLNCISDGEIKIVITELLFSLDLNMSFFRELLQNYIEKSKDVPEIKRQITEILISKGLTVESSFLVEMACKAGDDAVEETVRFIKMMLTNGVKIRSDSLSKYIESGHYYSGFMSIFHLPESSISEKALNNYVLYAPDDCGIKSVNALVFAEKSGGIFGNSECEVQNLGNKVRCNLFQAYTILMPDGERTSSDIVNAMKNARVKLNPIIYVNGNPVKFKKYIQDNKERLSAGTIAVCEENKVFSLLF